MAIRLLILIALLAAAGATGFIKGALWQADQAAEFKAEVKSAGAVQARLTKAIDDKHNTITRETHDAHAAGIDLVRTYYDSLRHDHAGGGALPIISADPDEPRPRSADAGSAAAEPAPRLAQSDERCAETTLMFIDLRNAWRDHLAVSAP